MTHVTQLNEQKDADNSSRREEKEEEEVKKECLRSSNALNRVHCTRCSINMRNINIQKFNKIYLKNINKHFRRTRSTRLTSADIIKRD